MEPEADDSRLDPSRSPSPPLSATEEPLTDDEDDDDGSGPRIPDSGDPADDDRRTGSTAGGGGKKRKRASTAAGQQQQQQQKKSCELCKARKVKCDRAEPACSWCARHNRTCVYLERHRPGSRIILGDELEVKVNRVYTLLEGLERRFDEHLSSQPATPLQPQQLPSLPPPPLGLARAPVSTWAPSATAPSPSSHGTPGMGGTTPGPAYPSPAELHSTAWSATTPRMTAPPPMGADGASVMSASPRDVTASTPHHPRPQPPSQHHNPLGRRESHISHISSLAALDQDLPPREMLYTLVDLYFKHCNTWAPILDRKTTFDVCFHAPATEANRVLLHAMVATTLRFFPDGTLSAEARAHYHATSKRIVQAYAVEHITVPALRAMLILCLDQLGTSSGPRGSSSLALVAHNVQQLGLNEESSVFLLSPGDDVTRTGPLRRIAADQPPSWLEDEGRRRLCWMVYILDRYATIAAITSNFALDDRCMKRVLPCSYDLFSRNAPVETKSVDPLPDPTGMSTYLENLQYHTQPQDQAQNQQRQQQQSQHSQHQHNQQQHPAQQQHQHQHQQQQQQPEKPDNLGSFSYHCEIIKTLSRVYEFLQTPIDLCSSTDMARWRNTYRQLDTALDNWLRSLPSEYNRISSLCHSDPGSRVANWFMLHSAYVVAVVRLHSAAAYPAVRSPLFVPSDYAVQRCLSAVQSLAGIVQDVREVNGLDLLGPLFAFSLWVAARLLLVHAASFADGQVDDARFHFFIETLDEVGQYWDVAKAYSKILGRMEQRRQARADLSYAAMRKNAFDLVNLASCTRGSGTDPMSTHVATQGELDCIEVFDFFNYPKLSKESENNVQSNLFVP